MYKTRKKKRRGRVPYWTKAKSLMPGMEVKRGKHWRGVLDVMHKDHIQVSFFSTMVKDEGSRPKQVWPQATFDAHELVEVRW